ncbi:MAG TPA: hypothetical protein VF183_14860 [Acidimicrobiales bacterium]
MPATVASPLFPFVNSGGLLVQLLLLRVTVAVITRVRSVGARADRGQATTEYVLVLLGVAAIAIAVATWATRSGKVGELLDRVFDHVGDQIS